MAFDNQNQLIIRDENAYYNGMNLERPTPQGNKYTLRNTIGNLN